MNIAGKEFYDIYGTWHVPFWQTSLFKWSILLLMFLVLFCISLYVLRKYLYPKKELTAWERALYALTQFSTMPIKNKDEGKQFYFAVTMILKKYFQERFQIDVVGKTDDEVILFLQKGEFPNDLFPLVQEIFSGSFTIKYANEQALKEQIDRDLCNACLIVKRTKLSKKKEQ
jgi:hypothetical protein